MSADNDKEKRGPSYFDVEKFRRVISVPSKPRGRASRILGRVLNSFDLVQGLFIPFFFLFVIFGTFLAIVFSISYGPWAFLLFMGCTIGGLGLFAERKLGDSAKVGEVHLHHMLRGFFAQFLAFLVFLGILFLLLFIAGVPPF